MSQTTREYIKSSVITFLAGFCLAILTQLDTLTLSDVEGGALIGLFFAGVRLGVKMVAEQFLAWYANR